jgi:hypothetical protein
MLRTAIWLLFALPLLAVAADKKEDAIAKLRKLMPKDQLEFAEKMDQIKKLNAEANLETNALKKKELRETVEADRKEFVDSMTKAAQKNGFQDWAGNVFTNARDPDLKSPAMCLASGGFVIYITYNGMSDDVKKVVRELKEGELAIVRVAPFARIQFVRDGSGLSTKTVVSGAILKSIEKAK